MRELIKLVEQLQLTNFDAFLEKWEDIIYSIDNTINSQNIEEEYYKEVRELNDMGRKSLFGFYDFDERWIKDFMADKIKEIDSTIWYTDEKIKGLGDVVLQLMDLDLDNIDVNTSVAQTLISERQCVCLKPKSTVFIASIRIEDQWYMIGKNYTTTTAP